jgi:hypothetical protein
MLFFFLEIERMKDIMVKAETQIGLEDRRGPILIYNI